MKTKQLFVLPAFLNKSVLIFVLIISVHLSTGKAQENYGKTFNAGMGAGVVYYGNSAYLLPVLTLNYEFNLLGNFTLAPFINYSYYHSYHYWGSASSPYENYSYSEVQIPFGVKGYYYFDELLNAKPAWDFYGACSIGLVYRNVIWESGYAGDYYIAGMNPLYFDLHLGVKYHVTSKVAAFLDISSMGSTVGLAIH